MRIRKLLLVVGLVAVVVVAVFAGKQVLQTMGVLDPPASPGATSSYTLEDIYNRLNSGATGAPSTFTEPTAGPGTGTMHTLDEIIALAGTACTQCDPPAELSPLGRWCNNKNGTVTDMTTGLVWLKDASWGGTKAWRVNAVASYHDDDPGYDDAHTRAGLLHHEVSEAGLDDGSVLGDWRLPTKTELVGLTTEPEAVSSDDMQAFTGVQKDLYWSSTASADHPSLAWLVPLGRGMGPVAPGDKVGEKNVWPVRGGQ